VKFHSPWNLSRLMRSEANSLSDTLMPFGYLPRSTSARTGAGSGRRRFPAEAPESVLSYPHREVGMLRVLAGIALLATAPLAAAPILIDGSGYATGSNWGHAYVSGEGVYFSLPLEGTGVVYGDGRCRAGALCNITFEGSGDVAYPDEIIGTYLGQTITRDIFEEAGVSFRGSVAVHGFPYPSDYQSLNVPVSADWTGLIRIWPGGSESASIELKFAGAGPARVSLEAYPNDLVCPAPPGGWTEQPPQSCFATYFLVRGLDGTFTGTLEEVPEPATWTALGAAGLMAVIGATARRRKMLKELSRNK
jgi:hypothetical protein